MHRTSCGDAQNDRRRDGFYLGDLLLDVISLRAATRKLEFDPGGDQLAKSRLDHADGPKDRDPLQLLRSTVILGALEPWQRLP